MALENTYSPPSMGDSTDNDDMVVDDTEGGVVLLEANPDRKSALIINTGEAAMRVTTDGSDPTEIHGKLVDVGGTLTLMSPYCPTNQVKACRQGGISTTANASEVS